MKKKRSGEVIAFSTEWMPEGFTVEDLMTIPVERLWTMEMVADRLVEAVKVAERAIRRPAPSQGAIMWPSWIYTFDDIIGHKPEDRVEPRGNVPREVIDRMEEALLWQSQYLKAEDGPARVLRTYLRCKAYRIPFDKTCKRKKWSRATAYRARDRAMTIIAYSLMRDGVKPR